MTDEQMKQWILGLKNLEKTKTWKLWVPMAAFGALLGGFGSVMQGFAAWLFHP